MLANEKVGWLKESTALAKWLNGIGLAQFIDPRRSRQYLFEVSRWTDTPQFIAQCSCGIQVIV